jgi:hypothetical protein
VLRIFFAPLKVVFRSAKSLDLPEFAERNTTPIFRICSAKSPTRRLFVAVNELADSVLFDPLELQTEAPVRAIKMGNEIAAASLRQSHRSDGLALT